MSRRSLWKLCCVLMTIALLPILASSETQEVQIGNDRNQIIRVCLTRLGERERLDFTFTAPYQLTSAHGSTLFFHAGSEVAFQIKNEQIYLYYQEMALELGKTVSLVRSGSSADMTGVQLSNFPALYMGDLQLDIIEGKFRVILSIHVEDYLLGVVPYEMGDSFPLEALKAQAIAARTYALSRQGQRADYDLVDNTNDQAFKGYVTGNTKSEKAVLETRGICGYYEGELAQCYYSASNGGQTELVESVWSSRKPYEYYVFGEDPYDVANPESVVRSFTLWKRYHGEKEAPYVLQQMAAERINTNLINQGQKVSADQIRIDTVHSVSVGNPSSDNSKHMTGLCLKLGISVRAKPEWFSYTIDTSPEEVYLFESAALQAVPTAEPADMAFVPLEEPVSIDIPIFPHAEEIFSMDISGNYQNEIWSVVENKDSFTLEARRYGHGVGMSQRGAQWMASEYAMSCQDILAFYYPGMDLIQFPEQERKFADVEDALSATAGPAPTPTPRPTFMPVTQIAAEGEWYATVTEITNDSSLNLRSAPSLNSDILMRLYKGQRLLVLARCAEEGWVHVRTDAAEGYVMESYLSPEK